MNVAWRGILKNGKLIGKDGTLPSGYCIPGCGYAGATRVNFPLPKTTDGTATTSPNNADGPVTGNTVQQAPEPRGLPLFGTLFSFLLAGGAKKQHEYVDKRHKQLGPVYRERLGPISAVFVNSPQEFQRIFRLEGSFPRNFLPEAWILYNEIRKCRRGLLFMDGEQWVHFRRILNKVMLFPDPTNVMAEPCREATVELREKWQEQIKGNVTIPNLQSQLYRWSIEAMASTLVGKNWSKCKHEFSNDFDKLARMLHKIFEYSAKLAVIPAKAAMNLRLPVWTKFVACADSAFETIRTIVPRMIELSDKGLLERMLEEGIREEDAARIVTDFILAAGDTTATTMQWILLMMSNHTECQENLYQHLRGLSVNEVLRDPQLKSVIRETLRLYPTAPFISRYLPENATIGNYFVPKGELVVLSVYSSGRDSGNFSQPDEFLPERWIRTDKGTYRGLLNPYASLPFALGARSCIGRKLAEIQITLALAELVRSFKIDCTNKDRVRMILHLISIPSESMELRLTRRE